VSTPITPATGDFVAPAAQNRPALVSEIAAACAIAALLGFATVVGWVAPWFFFGAAIVSSLVAIVAGHVGRARGRVPGGIGGGLSLAGIIVGWVCLVIAVLGSLVLVGIVAGIRSLTA
jgi:hypothetical protein